MKKPIFVLAPMANVTDSVFRSLIAKYGNPDVTWTEFVSADGLNSPGRKHLMEALKFSKKEKPVVAQLFTSRPESMRKAAALIRKLGFDGLDINMGCPDRAVERQKSGAAMIMDPENALAVLEAARDSWNKSAVSVKTRLGYAAVDWAWLETLLRQDLPVLTVHLRTRKELSEVSAHWELMPKIVALRDKIAPQTLIIGNGDVKDVDEALIKIGETGCDGVMIGRGAFGKPWVFSKAHKSKNERQNFLSKFDAPKGIPERLKALVLHAKMYEKAYKDKKSFDFMKKHIKAYVTGWDGARELRILLMESPNAKGIEIIVKEYLKKIRKH